MIYLGGNILSIAISVLLFTLSSIQQVSNSIQRIQEPTRNYVFFRLYSKENPNGTDIYVNDIRALESSNFDPEKNTFILVHGWMNNLDSDFCVWTRSALLRQGDYNVIAVDWSSIALDMNYAGIIPYVSDVGKKVTEMITFLNQRGLSFNKTRLIGHSMGAHIVGIAGYNLKGKVLYVIGLDPAFFLYWGLGPEKRISPLSGQNVEIIHTQAGLIGYYQPLGHADFYPNGGSAQKDCPLQSLQDLFQCSHGKSIEYFVRTILDPEQKFMGRHCRSMWEIMWNICNGPIGVMGTIRDKLPYRGIYWIDIPDDNVIPHTI